MNATHVRTSLKNFAKKEIAWLLLESTALPQMDSEDDQNTLKEKKKQVYLFICIVMHEGSKMMNVWINYKYIGQGALELGIV